MPFNTAVELSYLKPEEREKVVDFIKKEGVVPTMAQATEVKKASQDAAKAAPAPEKTTSAPKLPLAGNSPQATEKTAPPAPTKLAKAPAVSEVKRKVFNALDLQKKAEERQKAKQVVKDAAKRR
ncbi:hypothetical protein D7X94_10425 [Acutalibacter sp. 1XD8-33]|uniref:hypothetical protein n=1 Tax=Acutalibacter sp. 1XD8-33 TaxID=2320081 RepID=UPI000EA323F3|nr:hypothetical protein [Acutalibacter sp. 1XD8-33]RKJ39831.1 hypothetical protein D7X94_10425 [Acutalibacter sp. 1XD8-33]